MEGGSSSRERTETSGSTSSARDPLAMVLSAINSSQVEMRKLREEMRAAQEETAARQPSKKKERPYQFNKKGHEDQFQFNDGVVDRMDEAESHLARAARNLADDVLADNPEDERRLENAEKAAERKVLAKARKLDAAAKLKKGFGGREKPEPGQGVVTAVPVPKPQVAPVARPSGPLVCYSCGEDADVLLSRKGLSHDEVCFDGVWSREMDEGRNWEFQAGDGELLEVDGIRDFVHKAVSELVNGHFVEEVQEPTYICSPLSVVENSSGKKRLVENLRHVNQFLCKRRFKYEDLRIAMMLFSPGELMFNFDLKSGYHHVEIAGHHPQDSGGGLTELHLKGACGYNQNVVRILQIGSRKPNLQEQALKVFETCIIHQIRLEPEWIPRAQNELADFISRIVDYDDWQISPALFYYLEEAWGPYSVDRFADNFNTQLSRFNSRFACPGSEAVDTFTVHWGGGENNWWCPPPSLVARVVRHAETCKANGTLVVPHWESAPYWPLLCPDGMMFASFVGASEVLPGENIPGRSGGVMILSTRGHDLLISGSDILAAGIWPLMSNLEDPELQRLAAPLPDTVLRGKADSTTKKYLSAFRRWKLWAEARQGVPSFPAQDTHIALYLQQHLSESVESTSAIEEAVNALSWLHQAAGLQPVSGAPLVQAALAGFRRILAKPRVRKEPVTAEMLKSMVDSAGPDPSLSEVRLLAVCLLAFAAMLERYFHMGGLCSGSHDKVFRAIVNTKSGETLRLNALWNPCGWCSCDMFIFRTCASRVLHSLSTALCIYYIWLTFILAKQNNGTSDVEGPEEGDSLSDVVGPEEGDGPSDGEGPEEDDGPSDVVGPEEDVEGPEDDDGLQMWKGQKKVMVPQMLNGQKKTLKGQKKVMKNQKRKESEQERDGGGRQRVLVCLFLTLILSCVEVEDVLFPLGRGTVLLHSVEVSTTVHDMLLLLYDWHSNLGCHDTSDFQRLGNSGNLHVSPGVTLLHFMLSHQVMAKLTKAGITPFSHFASHILTWGAASVINQPDPSEKRPIHHAYQVAKTLGISRWESMVSPFVEHGAHRDAVDHSGACVPFHPATLMCLSCLAAKKIVCAGIPYRTLTILPSHIKEFIAFHDPS
eukprot:Em0004g876a